MLEITHNAPGGLKAASENEAPSLRELSWMELSSRFKAMRDYRRAISRSVQHSGGSFAPDAAARLAHPQHGINSINLDGSTLGKGTCATVVDIEISR